MKQRMSTLGLLLLLSLGAAAQVLEEVRPDSVQAWDPEQNDRGVYLTYGILPEGLFRFGTGHENMNALLERQGLSPQGLSTSMWTNIGLRFWHRAYAEILLAIPLWTSGDNFDAAELGGKRIEMNDYRVHLNISLGYAFVQSRNMALILRTGVGLAAREIRIVEYDRAAFNFNNFNQPPEARAWPVLSHFNGVGDISVEFLQGRAKRPVHLSPSLRVGYMFGFNSRAWEVGEPNTAINAPSDRTQVFYLSAGFNLSYNRERKTKP